MRDTKIMLPSAALPLHPLPSPIDILLPTIPLVRATDEWIPVTSAKCANLKDLLIYLSKLSVFWYVFYVFGALFQVKGWPNSITANAALV